MSSQLAIGSVLSMFGGVIGQTAERNTLGLQASDLKGASEPITDEQNISLDDVLKVAIGPIHHKLEFRDSANLELKGDSIEMIFRGVLSADNFELKDKYPVRGSDLRILFQHDKRIPIIKDVIETEPVHKDTNFTERLNSTTNRELFAILCDGNRGSHSQAFEFENCNVQPVKRRLNMGQNTDSIFLKLWLTYIQCVMAEAIGDADGEIIETEWPLPKVRPATWADVADMYVKYDVVINSDLLGAELTTVMALGTGPYPRYIHSYKYQSKKYNLLPCAYQVAEDSVVVTGSYMDVAVADVIADAERLRNNIVSLAHYLGAHKSSKEMLRLAATLCSTDRFIENQRVVKPRVRNSVCFRASYGERIWPRTVMFPEEVRKDTSKGRLVLGLFVHGLRLNGMMEEIHSALGWRTSRDALSYEGLMNVLNSAGLSEELGVEVMGQNMTVGVFGDMHDGGGICELLRTNLISVAVVGRQSAVIREPAVCEDLPVAFDGGWSTQIKRKISCTHELIYAEEIKMAEYFDTRLEHYVKLSMDRNTLNSWYGQKDVFSTCELGVTDNHLPIMNRRNYSEMIGYEITYDLQKVLGKERTFIVETIPPPRSLFNYGVFGVSVDMPDLHDLSVDGPAKLPYDRQSHPVAYRTLTRSSKYNAYEAEVGGGIFDWGNKEDETRTLRILRSIIAEIPGQDISLDGLQTHIYNRVVSKVAPKYCKPEFSYVMARGLTVSSNTELQLMTCLMADDPDAVAHWIYKKVGEHHPTQEGCNAIEELTKQNVDYIMLAYASARKHKRAYFRDNFDTRNAYPNDRPKLKAHGMAKSGYEGYNANLIDMVTELQKPSDSEDEHNIVMVINNEAGTASILGADESQIEAT